MNSPAGATYMSALSLGNVTGRYAGLTGSCRVSRQIVGALSFVSSFNAMRYQSESIAAYNRLIYTASVGLRVLFAQHAHANLLIFPGEYQFIGTRLTKSLQNRLRARVRPQAPCSQELIENMGELLALAREKSVQSENG
jgi:hypothetical protein